MSTTAPRRPPASSSWDTSSSSIDKRPAGEVATRHRAQRDEEALDLVGDLGT